MSLIFEIETERAHKAVSRRVDELQKQLEILKDEIARLNAQVNYAIQLAAGRTR